MPGRIESIAAALGSRVSKGRAIVQMDCAEADARRRIADAELTGERILQIADPAHLGVLVHLPVADAIALDAGAPVNLYLTTQPLSPLSGEIFQTSYQASVSDEGIASYRPRGHFTDPPGDVRIGLRGTAKVSGGWVVLGYHLIRRPLAALPERLGI